MTTIQLKHFIKTGSFGTITIGSSKNDVINSFGKKFDFADCGETQIISYGWYEFFYWTATETVFGIQNDHLQADCINHADMINFKNNTWTIDKWFLKDHENRTFEQVEELLQNENIPFTIVPAYSGCDENIIKCTNSLVTFDFAHEYMVIERNAKGKYIDHKEITETDQSKFVLNGIRLFNLPNP